MLADSLALVADKRLLEQAAPGEEFLDFPLHDLAANIFGLSLLGHLLLGNAPLALDQIGWDVFGPDGDWVGEGDVQRHILGDLMRRGAGCAFHLDQHAHLIVVMQVGSHDSIMPLESGPATELHGFTTLGGELGNYVAHTAAGRALERLPGELLPGTDALGGMPRYVLRQIPGGSLEVLVP